MRWPFNGLVTNTSSKDVLVLVSGAKKAHYEVLEPGKSTPDSPLHSKDADGAWVNYGYEFYPVGSGKGLPGGIEVRSDGVYNEGKKIKPWDNKNVNNSPESRGGSNDFRPNLSQLYGDASEWYPTTSEDFVPFRNGWERYPSSKSTKCGLMHLMK